MEKKQSSIDWLEDKLNGVDTGVSYHYFTSIIEQAKAMHKEEVEDAYQKGRFNGQTNWGYGNDITAEQYYNETFGGNNE